MNLKLPDIAAGRVIPHSVQQKIYKDEEQKRLRKKQRRREYVIVVFSAVISAVFSNFDRIIGFIMKLIAE